jgi:hypothetical protein
MNIQLNQKYSSLADFVRRIPHFFDNQGTLFYEGRNCIKIFEVNGLCLNVKRYHRPLLFNQLIYGFFRKPKAVKAYRNALNVLESGFETPEPIACILEKRFGLLGFSYFVSLHHSTGNQIRDYWFSMGEGEDKIFLKAFARYSAELHQAGIYHLDYSPGNILHEKKADGYHFTLVDINRMKFQNVTLEEGCCNFSRLFEYDDAVRIVAEEYAIRRGFDINLCIERMLHHKRSFLVKDKKRDLRKARKAERKTK